MTSTRTPVTYHHIPDSPDLIYFSSASENTKRFVEKIGRPALRIPLRTPRDGSIRVDNPFVLITPTYGGGELRGAVPKQVITFLNNPANRSLIRGVITSGNRNFGTAYCVAGPIISRKCNVPELFRFELLGTKADVATVQAGLEAFWNVQNNSNRPPSERSEQTTSPTLSA